MELAAVVGARSEVVGEKRRIDNSNRRRMESDHGTTRNLGDSKRKFFRGVDDEVGH